MARVFKLIETFIGEANELIRVFRILGENGDAVIHAYGDGQLQRLEHFSKYRLDATAQSEGLRRIRLRQQESELIAADAEGRVGSAQGFLQGSGSRAQYLITAGMAVLVIDFLEAVQVERYQSQGLAVAARAIEFLIESFCEEPAVVKAGQRVGDGIEFQPLQFFILNEDGNTKKTRRGKDIGKRGLQGNGTSDETGELAAARKHFIPNLQALGFAQIEMSDRTEVSLEELAARRQIETFESVCQQLEVRILNRQARGHRGAGAGHIRYRPNLCLSPRGLGKANVVFSILCGATKSPFVLDLGKSTGKSDLPNCGRILLQKRGIGYEKEMGARIGQSYVTKIPRPKDGVARNCRDLLKRTEEFQAEQPHLACRLLPQDLRYNGRSLAGDKAGRSGRWGGDGQMNGLIRLEDVR
jgi:hypothetical protein